MLVSVTSITSGANLSTPLGVIPPGATLAFDYPLAQVDIMKFELNKLVAAGAATVSVTQTGSPVAAVWPAVVPFY